MDRDLLQTLEHAWSLRRQNLKEAKAVLQQVMAGLDQVEGDGDRHLTGDSDRHLTGDSNRHIDVRFGAMTLTGLIAVYESRYDEARGLLEAARGHFEDGHLAIWLVRTLNTQGYLQAVLGQFGDALVHFKQALEWSVAGEFHEMTVFILFNIGELYKEVISGYAEARPYYQDALKICEGGYEHVLFGSILSSLSVIESNLGHPDQALIYAEQALEVAEKSGDAYAMGLCYEALATFYLERGELEWAKRYALECQRVRRSIADDYAHSALNMLLGRIAYEMGDVDGGIDYVQASLNGAARLQSKSLVADALFFLARAHEKKGNYRRSMLFYKAFSKKSSEKFSHDLKMQMSIMNSDMHFKAVQQDAEIYRLRNIELKEKSDEIERVVSDLESTLEALKATQVQLIHAEKMAALGSLVAGVAHEINTPLGVSITLNSYLQDKQQELMAAMAKNQVSKVLIEECLEASHEAISTMEKSLLRAADIVRSFKNLALDQSVLERRKFNVAQVLEDLLLMLSSQIRESGLQVRLDCPPMVVESYPGAISQIVTQFVTNSLQHGFDGGAGVDGSDESDGTCGHISIRAIQVDKQLVIQYRDDGVGIPPEILERIFEPFVTTKRMAGSIGLGMHSVYNAVKQILKGNIEVTSPLQGGTHITVNIPLDKH